MTLYIFYTFHLSPSTLNVIIFHIWNRFIGLNFSAVAIVVIFMLDPIFVRIFPLCTYISHSFFLHLNNRSNHTHAQTHSLCLCSSKRSGSDQWDLRHHPTCLQHWSSKVLEKSQVISLTSSRVRFVLAVHLVL